MDRGSGTVRRAARNAGREPWEAYPVLLAGSQLAKRADRRNQILDAGGWDLLVVDEAHHARRKDFKDRNAYRPNRLLSLIQELGERGKFAGLLLMTATPMQVHPVEVWDLLKLLGMGARWGADEENFLHFFSELQKDAPEADWDFVLDMVADNLRTGGTLTELSLAKEAQAKLGSGAVGDHQRDAASGRLSASGAAGAEAKIVHLPAGIGPP